MTRLSELAELIEEDSLPTWLKDAIQEHREEIQRVVSGGGVYTLEGPSGEVIRIEKGEKKTSTAAA